MLQIDEKYECLKDLIGVRSLCDRNLTKSKSKYIDDLEGIVPTGIANWANLETIETAPELVDSKIHITITGVYYDFLRLLNQKKQLEIKSILCSVTAGDFQKNKWMTPSANPRGVRIENVKYHSQMSKIQIDKVEFFSDKSVNNLTIYVEDGVETTTYNADIQANKINTVYLNYTANTDEIFVYVKDSNFIPNESLVEKDLHNQNCCNCNCCHKKSKCLRIYGWDGSKDDKFTFGLKVYARVICDKEILICSLRDELSDVFVYYLAMEIVKEGIFSNRMNKDTLSIDRNEKLLKVYKENYENKLKAIVDNVSDYLKRFDNDCIECNGNKIVQQNMGGYYTGYNLRKKRRSIFGY